MSFRTLRYIPNATFPLRLVWSLGRWQPLLFTFIIDHRALYFSIRVLPIGIEFEIKWPRRYR